MTSQSYAILLAIFILPRKVDAKDAAKAICSGQCEKATPNFEGYLNHALVGHTISIMRTKNPYTCLHNCFVECRCLSYQISNAGCELLDEDRFSKPASFQEKNGYKYYDMIREYYQTKRAQDGQSCLNTACDNGCCNSQPCLNDGRCKELCENPKLKFDCACPEGYTGKLCQIKPRSCKDYLGNGTNGKYVIFDKSGRPLTVFCDFRSENGFAWTLIESFSFQNNFQVNFMSYPFFKDHPLNETNSNWELYRLSFAHMKDIADESTYFRATCQFPVEGVKYVDYVRGKLNDTNVIDGNILGCAKYDYVNIRGHQCHNCTAFTARTDSHHIHIDGFFSSNCTLGRVPDALSPPGDDNFGFFMPAHHNHRCVGDSSSTTQWWLGGQ